MAMQVAVLGLGRFGTQLARTLAQQGNEVLVIDQNEAEVQRIADLVTKAAIADITDEAALRELGLGQVDVAVVTTAILEVSLLAVMNLQALQVTSIYAKAGNERHATILRRIGVDRVVQPEREGGERFAHLMRVRGAQDYLTLTAEYGIGVYSPPPRLIGKRLDEVAETGKTRRLLMLVRRDEVQLNPVRSLAIEADDRLVFAGLDEDLAREF